MTCSIKPTTLQHIPVDYSYPICNKVIITILPKCCHLRSLSSSCWVIIIYRRFLAVGGFRCALPREETVTFLLQTTFRVVKELWWHEEALQVHIRRLCGFVVVVDAGVCRGIGIQSVDELGMTLIRSSCHAKSSANFIINCLLWIWGCFVTHRHHNPTTTLHLFYCYSVIVNHD